MKYKTRPGTLLTKICDEYMIISGREAREYCPAAIQINETGAYIWRLLEKGTETDEIITEISTGYDSDEDTDISETVNAYIESLKENGYLLEEDQ